MIQRLLATMATAALLAGSGAAPAQELDDKTDQRQRRVVKILRTTNKAQVNQYVPVAYELKHVNPYMVHRFIRKPMEAEEGNWWTFVHPDGERGLAVVNMPVWMKEGMDELMGQVDRPGLTSSAGDTSLYYKLKHRDPTDPGFIDAVTAHLTPGHKFLQDVATGGIVFYEAPSGVEAAMAVIQNELDVPTRQILLRAKIYEIELKDNGTIGLDYHAWKNGPGRNLFALQAHGEYFRTSTRGLNGDNGAAPDIIAPSVDAFGLPGRRLRNNGRNAAYFYDVPSAYFDFLVVKGQARMLTAPRATVLHAETARFSTGEEILYYDVQNGPADDAGRRPADLPLDPNGKDVLFPDNRSVVGRVAEVGVTLAVTPTIGAETIKLDLDVASVSHLGYSGSGTPLLATSRVVTGIHAHPGQEYVVGGITRTRSIQTTRKVPILGSIPVLGWLFGGEITTAQKSLLVISVSAEPIEDYSGMGDVEKDVVETVSAAGMGGIELP